MRQIVSVFLLFSVLLSSAGFTLSKHFCGEELAHITLNETKNCCDSEEDMPSDCCHDEFEQLVLDDSQLDHQTLQLQRLTFITVRLLTQFLRFYPEASTVSPLGTAFHSPPLPDTALYLRVQSFLI
ncbi:MAG: hypothetical protein WA960_09980 [Tunicatimonas sp.]